MNTFHTPVLLKEVVKYLEIRDGKKYIDATIGGAGHAVEILKLGGEVLGIDVDQEAITYIKKILRDKDIKILREKKDEAHNILVSQYPNITLARGSFRDIDKIAHSSGFNKVSGIIFDLGVSSHQLDKAERGFSFLKEGPLDMRMDSSTSSLQTVTARDFVNGLTKGELCELFIKLGEEGSARKISSLIVSARKVKPIETTEELAGIVADATQRRFFRIHPATLVFQALRIAVNDELNSLKEVLPKAVELLEVKGRLLIISFHSLEDRIVKRNFVDFEKRGLGKIITKKPITPSIKEKTSNKRSRSAKLRIFEKN